MIDIRHSLRKRNTGLVSYFIEIQVWRILGSNQPADIDALLGGILGGKLCNLLFSLSIFIVSLEIFLSSNWLKANNMKTLTIIFPVLITKKMHRAKRKIQYVNDQFYKL